MKSVFVCIHNRKDCCQSLIHGAKVRKNTKTNSIQVYVGAQLCGTVSYEANKFVYPIMCHLQGSFVNITLADDYLTLCEVEVLGMDILLNLFL